MKLIVGLGNKGKKYAKTRHNVGFVVLDKLTQKMKTEPFKEKMDGEYTDFTYHDEKVMLLKPSKFMNLSGEVVQAYMKYFNIEKKDVLIIHDDMDIELGTFRIRQQGSSAGHNGLKNIELHLKTTEYNRIKIGISRERKIDSADYVLEKFNEYEEGILEKIIPEVESAILDFIENGVIYVMNNYNS